MILAKLERIIQEIMGKGTVKIWGKDCPKRLPLFRKFWQIIFFCLLSLTFGHHGV